MATAATLRGPTWTPTSSSRRETTRRRGIDAARPRRRERRAADAPRASRDGDDAREISSSRDDGVPESPTRDVGRRDALSGASATFLGAAAGSFARRAVSAETSTSSSSGAAPSFVPMTPRSPSAVPNYALRGPFFVRRLPRLEHTCVTCFPKCVGDACLLGIDVHVPSAPPPLPDAMFPLDGVSLGGGDDDDDDDDDDDGVSAAAAGRMRGAPYPLAILTSGFLVDAEQYASYARRLCSWGYVVLSYNKRENVAGNALDDVVSAAMVRDLIQWAKSDVLLAPLLGSAEGDNIGVYLVGHSRGGKISVLEAIDDDRVKAVTLLDPVDNTVYAPLGEGFPSAVRAMRGKETGEGGGMLSRTRTPPLCVIGGLYGGECAPRGSNYVDFLREAPRNSWGVEVRGGHFQFLDSPSFVQRAVCEEGTAGDAQVREVSQALMVAHGESIFRGVNRERAFKRTLEALEAAWGGGAFSEALGQGRELPWVVLQDGTG